MPSLKIYGINSSAFVLEEVPILAISSQYACQPAPHPLTGISGTHKQISTRSAVDLLQNDCIWHILGGNLRELAIS
jgi:hypothetical protein